MVETNELKPAIKSESGSALKKVSYDKNVKVKSEDKENVSPTGATSNKKRSNRKKNKTKAAGSDTGGGKTKTKKSDFKGGEAKMNGHVFELHDENTTPGQFTRTKQEVQRFVQAKYPYGHDIVQLLLTREDFDIDAEMPEDPKGKLVMDLDSQGNKQEDEDDPTGWKTKRLPVTEGQKELWKEEIKEFATRRKSYKQNKRALWGLLHGQCSPRLQAHLESLSDYTSKYKESAIIWLLNEIQRAMSKFERTRYPHMALADLFCKYFRFFQGNDMSDTNYDLRYDEFLHLLEHYESSLGTDPMLIKYEAQEDGKSDTEIEALMMDKNSAMYKAYAKQAQDRFFAAMYLRASNKQDYEPLVIGLENDYAQGSKRFPKSVTSARNIKLTFRKEYTQASSTKTKNDVEDSEKENPAVALAQIQPVNNDHIGDTNSEHEQLSDEEVPQSKSLFDYAFVSTSESTEDPLIGYNIALIQYAELVNDNDASSASSECPSLFEDGDSSSDSDDSSCDSPPGLVEREGDDTSTEGGDSYDSDSDDSSYDSPPGLVQGDDDDTSTEGPFHLSGHRFNRQHDAYISDDDDDSSIDTAPMDHIVHYQDDVVVFHGGIPRPPPNPASSDDESSIDSSEIPVLEEAFIPNLIPRNGRARFYDSSDDSSSGSDTSDTGSMTDSPSSDDDDTNADDDDTNDDDDSISYADSEAHSYAAHVYAEVDAFIARSQSMSVISSHDESEDHENIPATVTQSDDEADDESDEIQPYVAPTAPSIEDDDSIPSVRDVYLPNNSISLNGSVERKVPESWVLLDTASSVSIFCSRVFLHSIYRVPEHKKLRLHGTGGFIDVYERGSLPGFGTVWYSPHSVANILSFAEVDEQFDVSYHQDESAYHVTNRDGQTLKFARRPPGKLYYFDACALLADSEAHSSSERYGLSSNTQLVAAAAPAQHVPVSLTPSQQQLVERVEPFYRSFGCPNPRSLRFMLEHGKILDAPVTAEEFNEYIKLIDGAHPDQLAGHATRTRPLKVVPSLVPLSDALMERFRNIVLCGDICFIPRHQFLCTISDGIEYFTSQSLSNRKMETVFTELETVIHLYRLRKINPEWFLTDMEFQSLEDRLLALGVRLNITSANEHVGKIERAIRTTKEDVRTILHSLPFDEFPSFILLEAFLYAVYMRNLMVKPNINEELSPATIVTGSSVTAKDCALPFGTLCYVKNDPSQYNSVVEPRSVAAISLKPLGNIQGGYTFMQIHNWQKVTRYQWKTGAYTPEILEQIKQKAESDANNLDEQEQKDAASFIIRRADKSIITSLDDDDRHLIDTDIFGHATHHSTPLPQAEEANNENITNENDSEEDQDEDDDDDDEDDDHDMDGDDSDGDDDNDDDDGPDADADPEQRNDRGDDAHDDDDEDTPQDSSESGAREDSDNTTEVGASTGNNNAEAGASDDNAEAGANEEHDPTVVQETVEGVEVTLESGQRDARAKDTILESVTQENIIPQTEDATRPGLAHHNLRRKVQPKYNTTSVQVDDSDLVRLHYVPPVKCMRDTSNLYEIACTQMSAAQGVKLFGEAAEKALITEWLQLDQLGVYEGRHWWKMTKLQRQRAMRLVQLIKQKRCGKIKGRTCVDGRPQREYIPKEEATSPTAHLESLLLTFLQDASEDRCVGIVDIPGAFLTTPTDADEHVIVDGIMVDMLVESNPEYAKFVHTTKSGKKIVYLKLVKQMYGTLKAARMFYDRLVGLLKDLGFTQNPYDPCVMNKDINGHQCTVIWHVDDMKISHVEHAVVEAVMQELANQYGTLKPEYGDTHSYVGMEVYFPGDKTVRIMMKSYIESAIAEFPDELGRSVTSPASEHLFRVDPNGTLLEEKKRVIFHTIVARLLFISTRSRPDIYTTIAFLTSRCAKADEHDWKKLKRLLTYLRDTIDLELILKAESMSVIKWWVDAAYGVRHDFRSQTGAGMSLGGGIFQVKSAKQGLNTKSSTEAEVVAASDMAPYLLWTRYFLEAQGIEIKRCIMFQDNESAMLLERNGCLSSTKRTKHINIRFFWLKDRIALGDLEIKHCGTDKMIADYCTKPLQGAKFIGFRDQIMGHASLPDDTDYNQERVGNDEANSRESKECDDVAHVKNQDLSNSV